VDDIEFLHALFDAQSLQTVEGIIELSATCQSILLEQALLLLVVLLPAAALLNLL
jgi:hypothetical protein